MREPTSDRAGGEITPSLLRLVEREARAVAKLLPRDAVEYEDLVGFGHLGLMEAKKRFDPRRGVNFEAFARHRIRGAVFDGLRRSVGMFSRETYQRLRRQVVAWRIAGDPLPIAQDEDTRQAVAEVTYQAIVDLATVIVAESCEHEATPNPEEAFVHEADLTRMRNAVNQLDADDRALLQALYALDTSQHASPAQYADARGIHRSTMSRRHRRVLKRLRLIMAGRSP